MTYKIEAVDKSGNITTVTVHTKTIASISESITDLNELNITEDNRDAVNAVRNTALSVNTYYATPTETTALNEIIINCDALLDKIENVTQEYNRIVPLSAIIIPKKYLKMMTKISHSINFRY